MIKPQREAAVTRVNTLGLTAQPGAAWHLYHHNGVPPSMLSLLMLSLLMLSLSMLSLSMLALDALALGALALDAYICCIWGSSAPKSPIGRK